MAHSEVPMDDEEYDAVFTALLAVLPSLQDNRKQFDNNAFGREYNKKTPHKSVTYKPTLWFMRVLFLQGYHSYVPWLAYAGSLSCDVLQKYYDVLKLLPAWSSTWSGPFRTNKDPRALSAAVINGACWSLAESLISRCDDDCTYYPWIESDTEAVHSLHLNHRSCLYRYSLYLRTSAPLRDKLRAEQWGLLNSVTMALMNFYDGHSNSALQILKLAIVHSKTRTELTSTQVGDVHDKLFSSDTADPSSMHSDSNDIIEPRVLAAQECGAVISSLVEQRQPAPAQRVPEPMQESPPAAAITPPPFIPPVPVQKVQTLPLIPIPTRPSAFTPNALALLPPPAPLVVPTPAPVPVPQVVQQAQQQPPPSSISLPPRTIALMLLRALKIPSGDRKNVHLSANGDIVMQMSGASKDAFWAAMEDA